MEDDLVDEAVETIVVTMELDALDPDALVRALSRYVVVSRGHAGCRNIDLCASSTVEGRFVVISKWASPDHQEAHFDSPEMVEMARACTGLLRAPPRIDRLEGISAHDLA